MKKFFVLFGCLALSLTVNAQTTKSEVAVTNQFGGVSKYNIETRKTGPNQALIDGAYAASPKFNTAAGDAFRQGFQSVFNNSNLNSQNSNMMESKASISVDLLKGNSKNYKYIAIRSVSGWKARNNLRTIQELIVNAKKLTPVNAFLVQDTKVHKISDELYKPDISMLNDQTLVLDFHRIDINFSDRATKVVLSNSQNDVVFEGEFINVPFTDMLKPILVEYEFTQEELDQEKKELELKNNEAKNQAIDELKKLKELLDLGLLTQEEFDLKAIELKKIILNYK